jgi:hypothetical protein
MVEKESKAFNLDQLVEELSNLASEDGKISFQEINLHLPANLVTSEEIEELILKLQNLGIRVKDKKEEKPVKSEVKDSTPRAKFDDPVRLYLREMGKVPLLTRKKEIEIAQRIERGYRHINEAIFTSMESVKGFFEQEDQLSTGEIPVEDIIQIDTSEWPPRYSGWREKYKILRMMRALRKIHNDMLKIKTDSKVEVESFKRLQNIERKFHLSIDEILKYSRIWSKLNRKTKREIGFNKKEIQESAKEIRQLLNVLNRIHKAARVPLTPKKSREELQRELIEANRKRTEVLNTRVIERIHNLSITHKQRTKWVGRMRDLRSKIREGERKIKIIEDNWSLEGEDVLKYSRRWSKVEKGIKKRSGLKRAEILSDAKEIRQIYKDWDQIQDENLISMETFNKLMRTIDLTERDIRHAKTLYEQGFRVYGSDSRGQQRLDEGCEQVRLPEGVQVQHLRNLVDSTGNNSCNCGPGKDYPGSRPHDRDHAQSHQDVPGICTGVWKRTHCGRTCGSP